MLVDVANPNAVRSRYESTSWLHTSRKKDRPFFITALIFYLIRSLPFLLLFLTCTIMSSFILRRIVLRSVSVPTARPLSSTSSRTRKFILRQGKSKTTKRSDEVISRGTWRRSSFPTAVDKSNEQFVEKRQIVL